MAIFDTPKTAIFRVAKITPKMGTQNVSACSHRLIAAIVLKLYQQTQQASLACWQSLGSVAAIIRWLQAKTF